MLREPNILHGTDPEFFFSWKGKPLAAEKVLPDNGLSAIHREHKYKRRPHAIFVDGVQAELNTDAFANRATLINGMADAFASLRTHLKSLNDKSEPVTALFTQSIKFDQRFLDNIIPKNRTWLSQPSFNVYGLIPENVNVDPKTYLKRIVGGHLHFGLFSPFFNEIEDHRQRAVPLLDIFVGLMSVLLDRDPAAVERRKTYGLPGEYRLPAHGLEYRVLSNFWLRSPILAQMVMGFSRLAFGVLNETVMYNHDLEGRLKEKIDIGDVISAILANDADAALKIYTDVIKPFVIEHCLPSNSGLNPDLIPQFDHFLSVVRTKGLDYFFPGDPLETWCNWPDAIDDHQWERWCQAISLEEKQ